MKHDKKSLKEGSSYCKECDGTGHIKLEYSNKAYGIDASITCPQCHGNGQFDWIEQVVGKNKTFKLGFFPDGDVNTMYPQTIRPPNTLFVDYIDLIETKG